MQDLAESKFVSLQCKARLVAFTLSHSFSIQKSSASDGSLKLFAYSAYWQITTLKVNGKHH